MGSEETPILESVPTPDEIRQRMNRNAEENRLLRSLYQLSRRIHDMIQARKGGKAGHNE